MPDFIDLSKYLEDNNIGPMESFDSRVDRSGKPKPKDVRVLLNSGIEVKCEVVYDGLDPDRTRRFLVIAEIDWENYWPKELRVGEHPTDTTLSFRIPGLPDDEADDFAHQMVVVSEHLVETR